MHCHQTSNEICKDSARHSDQANVQLDSDDSVVQIIKAVYDDKINARLKALQKLTSIARKVKCIRYFVHNAHMSVDETILDSVASC